jgi:hypothetical protein
LGRSQLGPAPADSAAGAREGEPVVGVRHDQLSLELGDYLKLADQAGL